jgi:RNA polymerase sigma factor (sigma-70 family)
MSIATHEAETVPKNANYAQLVTRIRVGDTSAMEQVYEALLPTLRRLIFCALGSQDTNDAVNDTFCAAFRMIQGGAVREPERLRSYVWGIARIQILNYIQSRTVRRGREWGLGLAGYIADRQPSPEEAVRVNESRAVVREALNGLPDRRRDVLVRFYLKQQSPEEICRDLTLTATQFRLIKSHAKKQFGRLGKLILRRRKPGYSLWRRGAQQPTLQEWASEVCLTTCQLGEPGLVVE